MPWHQSGYGISGYWEQLAGGKGALWLGSIATFFAIAFFLAYTWQLLGDWAKLFFGFGAALVMLGLGEYSRNRTERWFSEGISGAGIAVLYLSIWAGSQSYGLLTYTFAFALMALTVFAGVLLALRYNALSLSVLATVGGFLTPVLLYTEGATPSGPHALFTYVTMLNAGILGVSLFRQWRVLMWVSFIATVLLLFGWAIGSYKEAFRWSVFTYATVNFALFLGCACFGNLLHGKPTPPQELLLIFADAGVYALAGHALIAGALGKFPSAFVLAVSALFALLSRFVQRLAPQNRNLQLSLISVALFFLTISLPIQLKQEWLVVGWSVQAAVLVTLGLRLNSGVLHRAGQIVLALTLLALSVVIVSVQPTQQLLFLNERALPLLALVAANGWMAAQARRYRQLPDELAPWYGTLATFGGAWLLAQEGWLATEWQAQRLGGAWQAVAVYLIALIWAAYSLLTYWIGARTDEVSVRFSAIVLAMLAAVLPVWGAFALPMESWKPFVNIRWLSIVLTGLLLAVLARMVSREQQRATPAEAEAVGFLAVVVSTLLLVGVSVEVYFGVRMWHPANWEAAAWFVLVAVWSLLCAAQISLGLIWKLPGLRWLGFALGAFAVTVLLANALATLPSALAPHAWLPVVNARAIAFLISTMAIVLVANILRHRSSESTPTESAMVGGIYALALAVLLWGITQETYTAFYYWHMHGSLRGDWQRMAQMAISLVWMLFAAVLLIGGIVRSSQPARVAALGLMGFTALKVFLFDLSFLDTPLRIISFGGLGLTLIGISWLYSRYGIGKQTLPSNP